MSDDQRTSYINYINATRREDEKKESGSSELKSMEIKGRFRGACEKGGKADRSFSLVARSDKSVKIELSAKGDLNR